MPKLTPTESTFTSTSSVPDQDGEDAPKSIAQVANRMHNLVLRLSPDGRQRPQVSPSPHLCIYKNKKHGGLD